MKAFYWTAAAAFALVGGWVLMAPSVGREAGESRFGTPSASEVVEPSSRAAPEMVAPASSQGLNGAVTPTVGDVTLSIEPPSPEGPHRVTAITSLPDGTSLMFTVTSKSRPGESYQDTAVVTGGKAEAGPFGKDGTLPPGQYDVEVTMPIPEVQSPETRRVIGDKGENLRGPLVKRGTMGATVERTEAFTLGSGSTPNAAQAVSKAKELLAEVTALEKATRTMAPLRQSRDTATLKRCGELMREHQPEAERLRDQASKLPLPLGMHIGIAAGHLVLCASCMDTAEEDCARARGSIKEAALAIAGAR